MKRRSFLALLGLSPVVGTAVVSAAARTEATVSIRAEAVASVEGGRSGYAVAASVAELGDFRSTGMFLEVDDEAAPSRVIVNADWVVLTDAGEGMLELRSFVDSEAARAFGAPPSLMVGQGSV